MIKKRKKKYTTEVYALGQNRYMSSTEVYALGQHICMSAHKARRVIDQIRGRSYEETLMILELMPYRACYPILNLVYSAAANASHNKGLSETSLIIKKAEVNEGTRVKKFKPRARGRSSPIKRPTCHIAIVLEYIRFYEKKNEYIMCFKKPKWININMTCPDTYNSGDLWAKK
uniref:Large ribosomal subunit protein uL22c n=1 Tax=Tropaeolum majus TaxID=4020 RepID=A0A6M8ZHY6_TROMA|nr:ribosomal protein L22 [Tropaeolum majus]QKK51125.1 ribosomal protein L22 [Tropaeolum majus]UVF30732.1 ribosomal protein L22 [Tropaeolum majus]UVF31918.1 ribosomal protein L22 [Tropaeolum majus]UVF36796.1 ribosomal protein L22 [Tropaeolum majus]